MASSRSCSSDRGEAVHAWQGEKSGDLGDGQVGGVSQEILHRYAATGKREAIVPAFQLLLDVVDDVLAIEKADILRAGEIVQNRALSSARDSLHLAAFSPLWKVTGGALVLLTWLACNTLEI